MVDIRLEDVPVYITAAGALGVAAYGLVDAVGKTLFVFDVPVTGMRRRSKDGFPETRLARRYRLGLPFVGYSRVRALMEDLAPALKATYGDDFETIIREQYRAGRGQGLAPETIRQGVRLGLPFLGAELAGGVIHRVWGLDHGRSYALASALLRPHPDRPREPDESLSEREELEALDLAGRFATALDTKVQAAFDVAEQMYQARAQFWAGVTAVALALVFQASLTPLPGLRVWAYWSAIDLGAWARALIIGLAAVPLAPLAKDLASKFSDALGALRVLNQKAR